MVPMSDWFASKGKSPNTPDERISTTIEQMKWQGQLFLRQFVNLALQLGNVRLELHGSGLKGLFK